MDVIVASTQGIVKGMNRLSQLKDQGMPTHPEINTPDRGSLQKDIHIKSTVHNVVGQHLHISSLLKHKPQLEDPSTPVPTPADHQTP